LKELLDRSQWPTTTKLATWEANIQRITVPDQPEETFRRPHHNGKTKQNKNWAS
jgi:hypothetical protein